jgi:hypothetical protein
MFKTLPIVVNFENENVEIPPYMIDDAIMEIIREDWEDDDGLFEAVKYDLLDYDELLEMVEESFKGAGSQIEITVPIIKSAVEDWVEEYKVAFGGERSEDELRDSNAYDSWVDSQLVGE